MWFALLLAACTRQEAEDTPVPTPTGTTGDTTDTGPAQSYTGPDRLFDDVHQLVIPDRTGLAFVANDGTVVRSRTWTELAGDCAECGGEGASADGDGFLLSFTLRPFSLDGGIVRVDAALSPDFRLDGFVFPHDAVRDPVDGAIIVPEATADRITWVAGDGSSNAPIRSLAAGTPQWVGGTPNGIDRFDHQGRSLLLSSHRGGSAFPPGPSTGGELTLWDITVADDPELLWRYPADGGLVLPHGPVFRGFRGRWWLVYAHSGGATAGGSSVGLAVTDDPTIPPEYVADLVPAGEALVFLRGVELTTDGWLYLTDSGGTGGFPSDVPDGRVLRAPMPTLLPTGATGAIGFGQVFHELEGVELFVGGLSNPFEGWLWASE